MVERIFKLRLEDHKQVENFLKNDLPQCITTLARGGTLVYPTETLYGLGVDITNELAIEKIIKLKGRPQNLPIAIAVTDSEQVIPLAELSNLAMRIIKICLPKPITILLKAKSTVNKKLLGGSKLIGIRFPEHPLTVEIIKRFGPLTATSANLHGASNPITVGGAIAVFGEAVDIYLDTGPCKFAQPSTVVDTTGDTIRIIRHGACSGSELEDCLRGC